jgi:type IV secretion system protein VirB5
MMRKGIQDKLTAAIAAAMFSMGASAQGIPVYDNANFLNSIQQLVNTVQQLKTMYSQLTTMQNQLTALTGARGFENLMRNQMVRDYLPGEWQQVGNVLASTQTQYSQIADTVKNLNEKNAVLAANDLARMSPQLRDLVQRTRTAASTQSALATAAYNNASTNVSRLQVLMDSIRNTNDPKAIAELQARINSEQTMLQNDAIKLSQASQNMKAEVAALDQQAYEQAAAMAGSSLDSSNVRIRIPGQH